MHVPASQKRLILCFILDILKRHNQNFIPTTPASGVAGLDQSGELFSVSSRKRGKDDSFIAAFIQSDHSLPRYFSYMLTVCRR